MKIDYSKTINEQLEAFNYYKDRYCSYELQIMKLQSVIDKAITIISKEFLCYDNESDEYIQGLKIIKMLKEVE